MAERTLTEFVDNAFVHTWRLVRDSLIDNVFKIRPFYNKMVENGRIRQNASGGRFIEVPVIHAETDSNVKWLGRGEELGQAEDEFLTHFEYPWRYLGTGISRFFQDDQQNRGTAKMQDFIEAKVTNARNTLIARLESSTFTADGSGIGILSLQDLVADDPTTGTVAGINRANSSWARNQTLDFSGGGFSLAADMIPRMTGIYNDTSEFLGGSRATPDVIVTTKVLYEEYEARARALQQITASSSIRVSLGFGDLAFKGVEIFWAPECPTGHMYFLNTEHISFQVDPFAYFDMGPWKEKVGSRDRVTQIIATCALTMDHFQKQAVIFNMS